MLYVDYKKGGKAKWQRCSLAEISGKVLEKDFHVSWQMYTNERQGQYGPVYGHMVFDFDHDADVNVSRLDCIKVYDYLLDLGVSPQNIKLYFSGNKGFHMTIDYRSFMDKPVFDLHQVYKQFYFHIESKIKPEKGNSTMDRLIYSIRKTLRYPNTIHPRSGMYKVQLSYEELKSDVNEIYKLAKNKRGLSGGYVKDVAMTKIFEDAQTAYYKTINEMEKRTTLIESYTGNYPPCISKVLDEGVSQGERNYFIYLLARFLKKNKSEEEVYKILEGFCGKVEYSVKDARPTIKSALDREGAFLSCSEMKPYCDKEHCNIMAKKESLTHFDKVSEKFNSYSYPEAVNMYLTAKSNGEFNRVIKTDIKRLDKHVEIWRDGVTIIAANSNVGKTSLAVTIAANNQDRKLLYLAIEEGAKRTAKRFIEAGFRDTANVKVVTAKLGEVTPEDIWSLLYCNTDADALIVDQLVNLNFAAREERLKYKRIMEKARETARHFGIPHFFLHQLNREAGRADEPCMYHLAEGADIERLAYDIWLLYRREHEGKLINLLKIAKAKQGPAPIILPLEYDFKTKTFKDYTEFISADMADALNIDFKLLDGIQKKEAKPEAERLPLSFMDASGTPDWAMEEDDD